VISPLLMNVALHGMEQAAGVRYYAAAPTNEIARGCPVLVRYADDLLALCHTRAQAEQVQATLAAWLQPTGLAFNVDKTTIRHLDAEGCDFLGYSIRRYRGKLLIKPSPAAMRRIRKRLTAEMRALRGGNAAAVITTLNPIIRGWAAYYRNVVSSKAFAALDDHMWRLTYKWASHTHGNKPKHWVTARYFGRFHPSRQDRWIFDRDSGTYLTKFSWTKIVRHTLVNADASPDNPGADRVLGNAAPQKPSPAGPHHPAPAPGSAWPLSALPGTAPARRPRTTQPPRMGTVIQGHPQGHLPSGDPRRRRPQPGQPCRASPHTRPLPTTGPATST
jgi:RNA-directed DNA polymerase